MTNDIRIVIIMATYHRENGSTIQYLERSLSSVISQTYNKWDLIVVGDKYEPLQELENIISKYIDIINDNKLDNKIIHLNNYKVERDYIKNKRNLWSCAGANSVNMGLKYAREHGYKYYSHLDDDDYWTPDHLHRLYEAYNAFPNCIFVNTQSTYKNTHLPREQHGVIIRPNNRLPLPFATIHSSFSFRLDVVPFEYYTSFDENSKSEPSDSIMLSRIHRFILENRQYCSIYMPFLTCYHDEEFANY